MRNSLKMPLMHTFAKFLRKPKRFYIHYTTRASAAQFKK